MKTYIIRTYKNTLTTGGKARSLAKFVESLSSDLTEAVITNSDLRNVNLKRGNLIRADFTRSNLAGANLSEAYLEGASLRYANLKNADLSYANLSCANLRYANLSGADIEGAVLDHVELNYAFGIATFTSPTSLRTCYAVRHRNFCMIRLGCWWGTEKEAVVTVKARHGDTELSQLYIKSIQIACEVARANI